MATYPASGTIESNVGIPQGLLDSPVKTLEYVVDLDALLGTARLAGGGDTINVAALPANTVILGGQVEVIEPPTGITGQTLAATCNSVSLGAFAASGSNTAGAKTAATFPAPGANTVLPSSTNIVLTSAGTIVGTCTKNGKYKVRVFAIKAP